MTRYACRGIIENDCRYREVCHASPMPGDREETRLRQQGLPLEQANAAALDAQRPTTPLLAALRRPLDPPAAVRESHEDHRQARHRIRGCRNASPRRTRLMPRNDLRPVVKLRSTAGTGHTYVTRKNRRNDPDRLRLRKYDPVVRKHVEYREER